MSYISDFKSVSLSLFTNNAGGQAYSALPAQNTPSTVGTGVLDPNLESAIGQKFNTADGRTVALVRNGATALTTGKLMQSPAEQTAHQKLAMTVPTAYPATAGQTQILVTNGSTVVKVNEYAGGTLIVASGTGIGQTLRIASNQAAANAGTFVVTTEDPIVVTLDATSKISLLKNQYDGIIISPDTTATGSPVGVTLYPVAAGTAATYSGTTGALTAAGVSQYAFICTKGFVSCLVDSTVTNIGYPLGVSKTTAGTVGVATLTTVPQIAVSAQTLTSANNGLILLSL